MSSALSAYLSPRSFIESGKITVPQLFEWHARENAAIELFRFHTGHTLEHLAYAEVYKGSLRAARSFSSFVGPDNQEAHVIGILAHADSITYATVLMGILCAGHIAFPISPRNSAAGVADLLRKTKCTHIVLTPDPHVQRLAQEALSELENVMQHKMPRFEDLYGAGASANDDGDDYVLETPRFDHDSPAYILHSSGSTNHPKPITWSHHGLIAWGTYPWNNPNYRTGEVIGFHSVPMFHAMGSSSIIKAAANGWVLCVFPPATPPTVANPENVFEGAVKTGADAVHAVPSFIELWASDPDKVTVMKRLNGLMYGSAPLKKAVGDSLSAQGVPLIIGYGTTETGTIAAGAAAKPDVDWDYFSLSHLIDPVMRPMGDGTYELLVLATSKCPPAVINDKVDGIDAYATNDILEPHPTEPGYWKIYGRVDDQIVLSNGEKTNPAPLEHIITADPHIRGCLLFGRGKFQNGLLIEPTPGDQFDAQDEKTLTAFRNKIWPTVERANAVAPQHSHIFKEMIIVASPSKPFMYNVKGVPRRPLILREYEREIEELYATVEQSARGDVPPPSSWSSEEIKTFVQNLVERILGRSLPEDADLFRNGCDSLQATYIRNSVLRALRDHSPAAAMRLPMNVIFQAPSISALTEAVHDTLSESSQSKATASTPEDLVRLAEHYSSDLPTRPSILRPRESTKDVVVVTGTTGGFGCDILEHLLRDDEIGMVYAFNRKGTDALARQRARFHQRGHDEEMLDSPKFRMVEVDLLEVGFAVEPGLLDEIRSSVTHIMHNAWQVNFNLNVSSFEGDFLGLRNLIELALSSPYTVPPKVVFVSSIGVVAKHETESSGGVVPEEHVSPISAIGSGYTESKWVAEETLRKVSDQAGIHTTSVRLGQVCGDKLGHWNEKEWFPALVKSALFTRCLPENMNAAAFILSHPAARAFVEMRKSSSPTLHLVHPRPVPWMAIITPIAQELDVPLVPYSQWLAKLEKSAAEGSADEVDAMRANPALRLLQYFRARGTARSERSADARLSTTKGELASAELASMPALGTADVKRWIAAWRATGFLPSPAPV